MKGKGTEGSSRGASPVDDVVQSGGECDCRTAEEFLRKLDPLHAFWSPNPGAWIFRGHADSNWKLLASAQRGDEAFDEFTAEDQRSGLHAKLAKVSRTHDLLVRFQHALDDAVWQYPFRARRPCKPRWRWR
jgi:hypothetical protein